MYYFGSDITAQYETGTKKEWIITNSLGGYASSTVIGANTRTYHGLLIAALNPPVSRILMLSSIDEEIIVNETIHHLATHRYHGAIYPQGFRYIKKFQVEPFPKTTFAADGLIIEKEVFMPHGQNTTVITYEISNSSVPALMRLYPLVNMRSIHSISRYCDLTFTHEIVDSGIMVSSNKEGKVPLFIQSDQARFSEDDKWYYNFKYDMEQCRGLSYIEDNYNPGFFELPVKTGKTQFSITASTQLQDVYSTKRLRDIEIARLMDLRKRSCITDELAVKLVCATDSFIVKRRSTNAFSIIAGYHWFSDWGRDAMISIPGLTLITQRFEVARQILSTFAEYCKDGLIPNCFSDSGESAEYNTVDASLWFFYAVYKYLKYTGDLGFIEKLWCTLCEIISYYRDGTQFGIHMDEDGLITSDGQLTWMDAMVGSWMVTPRSGKSCEINALWYNALKLMEDLAIRFGDDTGEYSKLAMQTKISYGKFWNEKSGCLYDVIDETGNKDASVRPNQIIAVWLPYPILPPDKEKKIVGVVQRELLTPMGLRTLSRGNSAYKGQYRGDMPTRDSAYHQGTVWAWLMGPFVSAYCKVNGHSPESLIYVRGLFEPLVSHLNEAGLGTISEIFDGDYPHEPRGSISQAWSVAEVLRSYVEDVLNYQ